MDKEFLLGKGDSREESTRVLFCKCYVSMIGYNQEFIQPVDTEGKKTVPNNLQEKVVVPLHAQIQEDLKLH